MIEKQLSLNMGLPVPCSPSFSVVAGGCFSSYKGGCASDDSDVLGSEPDPVASSRGLRLGGSDGGGGAAFSLALSFSGRGGAAFASSVYAGGGGGTRRCTGAGGSEGVGLPDLLPLPVINDPPNPDHSEPTRPATLFLDVRWGGEAASLVVELVLVLEGELDLKPPSAASDCRRFSVAASKLGCTGGGPFSVFSLGSVHTRATMSSLTKCHSSHVDLRRLTQKPLWQSGYVVLGLCGCAEALVGGGRERRNTYVWAGMEGGRGASGDVTVGDGGCDAVEESWALRNREVVAQPVVA